MTSRETKRAFDEIVGHLADEDPAFTRPSRIHLGRVSVALLIVGGALLWAALSILMVMWGAPGVVLTCVVVALAVGAGLALRKRNSIEFRFPEDSQH